MTAIATTITAAATTLSLVPPMIAGVAAASAGFTFLGLLAVIWGLHGWTPQGSLKGGRHEAGAK